MGLFNKAVIGGNLAFGMGDGELTNQYPAQEILREILGEMTWGMAWGGASGSVGLGRGPGEELREYLR